MKVHKLEDWLKENKSYVVFSLLVGFAGMLAGAGVAIATGGMLRSFFMAALVIGAATSWRYARLWKLLGPIVAVSLISTVLLIVFSAVALREFGGSFGVSASANTVLMIVGAPLIFVVYAAVLFIPSVVFYVLARVFFGMFGREPRR